MVNYDGLLQAALRLATNGYPVFPLSGKQPAFKTGKNFSNATTDEPTTRSWWGEKFAGYNIGIQTGPRSGLLALDIDARTGGFDSLKQLTAIHGELPRTVNQRTGGGGQHFLFKYPDREIRTRTGIGPGIDLKAKGGYIVAPPSIHPDTKQQYQWDDGASLFDRELADCPSWLIDIAAKPMQIVAASQESRLVKVDPQLLHYGQKALEDECRTIECAGNGTQETTLNDASFRIGQLVGARAISFETAYSALFAAALNMPSFDQTKPWRGGQLSTKIRRALDEGMRSPRDIPDRRSKPAGPHQQQDLITAIHEINKTHAVVQVGSKTRILRQGTCDQRVDEVLLSGTGRFQASVQQIQVCRRGAERGAWQYLAQPSGTARI